MNSIKKKVPQIRERECKVCHSKEVATRKSRIYDFCEKHLQEYFIRQKEINEANNLAKYGYKNGMQNPINKQNYIKSLQAKYGEDITNISQIPGSREKAIKTFTKNYPEGSKEREEVIERRSDTYKSHTITGDYNSPEVLAKREATVLITRGYKNVNQDPEVKAKTVATHQAKRGVDHHSKLQSNKNKVKETVQENYGVDCVFQSPIIREKIITKNIQQYGYPHRMQNQDIIKTQMQKNKERTGYTCNFANPENRRKAKEKFRSNYWDKLVLKLNAKNIQPLFSKEEYIIADGELKFMCKKCNKVFTSAGTNDQSIFCPCAVQKSSYEFEIIEWLKTLKDYEIISGYKPEYNGRRLESDIYIPKEKLGVEFHGLYWHSSEVVENYKYHQIKYNHFKEQGINLIQIFENEWLSKKEIVQSIIKNKLKLNKIVFARKCKIKEIDYNTACDFLEKNHLQGYANASIRIGLYLEGELVALSTFNKSRFSEENCIELIRFCNKINISVVGGFQKLLKYYVTTYKPNKIISYCDLRYFDGSGYIASGFTIDSITEPNYFYFKEGTYTLHNRMKFQKHKLKDLLPIFDENKSEYENMRANKYLKIYDAGNLKLTYQVK